MDRPAEPLLPDPDGPSSSRSWASASLYGTTMHRRFGWMHAILGLGRSLRGLHLSDPSVEHIRGAAAAGRVVYVLLRASSIDHLALNRVLAKRRLPLSIWANGITTFWWRPFAEAWGGLFSRLHHRITQGAPPDPVESGWLTRVVDEGAVVTVFLEHPRSLAMRVSGQQRTDPLDAVLRAQDSLSAPIHIVPIIVVWDRAPDRDAHPMMTLLRGSREAPSLINRLRLLFTRSRAAFVQVGEPLDLQEFVRRATGPQRVDKLRTLLRRFIQRESHIVRGPHLPSREVMAKLVLDNPPMRRLAVETALAQGTSPEVVRRAMHKELDGIAARFWWPVIRLMALILRPLWTRVYSGVDVPDADMERIRSAMRDGSAILMPSHKSHFDYVLMAWVFFKHKLVLPHVVAGANLNLPVLSFFLRSGGGFFIKRSFEGEILHAAVFRRYLMELSRHGYPIEFYLEGGRTRSGKLMPPKVGVLGMVMDAAARRPSGTEVTLLPISIGYERVAEEQVYARELGGAAKKKETLGQFARAAQVIRRRYGRVYLRVGRPIPVSSIVDEGPDQPEWDARDRTSRRDALHHTGRLVIDRIGECTVLLPTSLLALALLAHHRRGIEQAALLARVERFSALLARRDVQRSASFDTFDAAIRQALARFEDTHLVTRVDHAEGRVWAIAVEHRLTLDFYKNQAMHWFAPTCIAAAAIRPLPRQAFTAADLRERFTWLADLMDREFIFNPDATPDELMLRGLDDLTLHGALSATTDGWEVAEEDLVGELYGLFRNFLETYLLVLRQAPQRLKAAVSTKAFLKSLQDASESFIARGAITRPETLSLVTLQNAVKVLIDRGAIQQSDGLLTANPGACATLEATLAQMVDR